MINCVHCGQKLNPRGMVCDHCTRQNDTPNIRLAKKKEEVKALEEKYSSTISSRSQKQKEAILCIENCVKKEQRVAIARSAVEIATFLAKPEAVYQTYHQQVFSNGRYAGLDECDVNRGVFENAALPNIADQTVFGSLSVADRGQPDFGSTTMILLPDVCKPRTTFFWGNPYVLSKQMNVLSGDTFPEGYRSTWENGYKLVTCKHHEEVGCDHLSTIDCHNLLNKATHEGEPDYIEAHYWTGFKASAIAKIVFTPSLSVSDTEIQSWELVKAYSQALHTHIVCEEAA